MNLDQYKAHMLQRRQDAAENALKAIDALVKDLQDLEKGIEAWERGEKAIVRDVYGNRMIDVPTAVSAYMATVQDWARAEDIA